MACIKKRDGRALMHIITHGQPRSNRPHQLLPQSWDIKSLVVPLPPPPPKDMGTANKFVFVWPEIWHLYICAVNIT